MAHGRRGEEESQGDSVNRIKCLLGHGLLVLLGAGCVTAIAIKVGGWIKAFAVIGIGVAFFAVLGWAVWQVLLCWERR
jgi:hypothetical protein